MIHTFALLPVLGLPLFTYFGMLAFLLALITIAVGFLNFKGVSAIPFKWHPRLALTMIAVAFAHMFLALSVLFNF